jgi:hypothetical protein
MKTNPILASAIGLPALITLMTPCIQAQSGMRITDVYVAMGLHGERDRPLTLDDFRMLAPNSVFLNQDLSGYDEYSWYGSSAMAMYHLSLGISFRDGKTKTIGPNPQLRLGASYISDVSKLGRLGKIETWAWDTLTSTQTGETYIIDSVVSDRYTMHYSSDRLRLDASLIWRTDPEDRWSLFAGVNVAVGLSINAATTISHSVERYTAPHPESNDPWSHYSFSGYYVSSTESFHHQSSIGYSALVPLGIDWRVGKRIPLLKKIHLFYELRPGIHFLALPELTTLRGFGAQQLCGLRVAV